MPDAPRDGAPDDPPMGGFEQRAHIRRADDQISHDMESWVARLFVHRGKLIFLASCITFTFTSLGFRVLGPTQEIKSLDQKFSARDSVMSVRVTRLEDRLAVSMERLANIEEQLRFLAFLQCTGLRTTNPNLALDGCPVRKP